MPTPFSTEPAASGGISGKAIGAAAGAIMLILLIVGLVTLRHPAANAGALLPLDGYAPQLSIGDLTLSEATNGGGGKVTYVDGTVTNTGDKTLTAATVQVTFATEDGSGPQRQTVPLMLIRTRQPYVDLESVSSEPVAPGRHQEFRLIFETVPAAWNTQPPEIRLVHAETR